NGSRRILVSEYSSQNDTIRVAGNPLWNDSSSATEKILREAGNLYACNLLLRHLFALLLSFRSLT
ncbi:MAG TPA: hypothetical protein DHW38_01780, partial [Planctomycetaceae bacterium]|nr:hypothetical protein [Planctomycetaceae bacterium]HCP84477.1 hypothetical protein [Planctomycetaceae bacterium]